MNFVTNTLTITKGFNRRANNENTEEYRIIKKLRQDCPNLRIVFYTPKQKKSPRLTYEKMISFIGCQNDAAKLLQEFNTIRNFSKAQPSTYNYVKSWFMNKFPNYRELPKFDKHGNLVDFKTAVQAKRANNPENKPNDAA